MMSEQASVTSNGLGALLFLDFGKVGNCRSDRKAGCVWSRARAAAQRVSCDQWQGLHRRGLRAASR